MSSGGRDVVSGAVLLLASLALLVVIPDQVVTTEAPTLTPAFVPTVMAISIAVLSLILLIQGLLTLRSAGGATPAKPAGSPVRGVLNVAAVILVIALQTALLTRAGYLGATGLAVGVLALLYGHRNWWQIALLVVLTPPAIMVFFRYTMLVLLPAGTWFE